MGRLSCARRKDVPTSQRKVEANRRNARLSTGPRSPAGKARAARNAMRHGLAAATADWACSAELQQLANLLNGEDRDGLVIAEARNVAEATLQIIQIRQLRTNMINGAMAAANSAAPRLDESGLKPPGDAARMMDGSAAARGGHATEPFSETERAALAVAVLAKDVERLDRYECRAFSRRKMAARRLGRHRRRLS
jgi:hypothetical protein